MKTALQPLVHEGNPFTYLHFGVPGGMFQWSGEIVFEKLIRMVP